MSFPSAGATTMTVIKRQRLEGKIAAAVIQGGLDAGYTISVHNGEEVCLRDSTSRKDILEAMNSVDDEHLLFFKDGKRVGFVYFVYGNDGYDVVNDYSLALEPIMAEANKIADKFS